MNHKQQKEIRRLRHKFKSDPTGVSWGKLHEYRITYPRSCYPDFSNFLQSKQIAVKDDGNDGGDPRIHWLNIYVDGENSVDQLLIDFTTKQIVGTRN